MSESPKLPVIDTVSLQISKNIPADFKVVEKYTSFSIVDKKIQATATTEYTFLQPEQEFVTKDLSLAETLVLSGDAKYSDKKLQKTAEKIIAEEAEKQAELEKHEEAERVRLAQIAEDEIITKQLEAEEADKLAASEAEKDNKTEDLMS